MIMILYKENPKDYWQILELIKDFSKVTRCRVNIQKSSVSVVNGKINLKDQIYNSLKKPMSQEKKIGEDMQNL